MDSPPSGTEISASYEHHHHLSATTPQVPGQSIQLYLWDEVGELVVLPAGSCMNPLKCLGDAQRNTSLPAVSSSLPLLPPHATGGWGSAQGVRVTNPFFSALSFQEQALMPTCP